MSVINDIQFSFCKSNKSDKSDLFTPNHQKYDCVISYCGVTEDFVYQCCGTEPTLNDVIECLLMDMSCYESSEDLADFLYGYGFVNDCVEDMRKGIKAYEGCKENAKKMHNLFFGTELQSLYEELDNIFPITPLGIE